MKTAVQNGFQFLHLNRLAHEVVRSLADRAERVLLFCLARGNDDLGQSVQVEQLRQSCHAFFGRARGWRQSEVQDHHHRPAFAKRRDRTGPVFGQQHIVILEESPFHLRTDFLVIIHNQNFRFHAFEFGTGSQTRKVVPLPFWLSTSILPR